MTPGPRLAKFVSRLVDRQRRDYDNILVVDGEEGSGKSNNGLYLANLLDHGYDPHDVVYNFDDFTRVCDDTQGKTILIDEGGNLGFNRDWNVAENKEFVKFMMVARQQNYNLIFCIPNFNWLDKYFREHRARYWAHMVHRDRAILLQRLRDWRNNQVRWKELFAYRPINVKRVWPETWRVYHAQKRGDFLGHPAAKPPPRSQPAPSPSSAASRNGSRLSGRHARLADSIRGSLRRGRGRGAKARRA